MPLGNNRDYKTRDRRIRCNFAVVKARTEELIAAGVQDALKVATEELNAGKLADRVKAWKDPILEHHRAMRKKWNAEGEG